MEPLGKMNAYFPVVNEHITKRNKKVMLSTVDRRPQAIRLNRVFSSWTSTLHVVNYERQSRNQARTLQSFQKHNKNTTMRKRFSSS